MLDAAERLLVDSGHAAITTRRLAEEAGVNHGLEGHAALLAWTEEVVRGDG